MTPRKNPPSVADIVDYWFTDPGHLPSEWIGHNIGLLNAEMFGCGVDMPEAHERCWRCSTHSKRLEKCHIIPHALGGPSDPSNLILLCHACHLEMPNIGDKSATRAVWMWIKKTSEPFYDTFWVKRVLETFKEMYGRYPNKLNAEKFESCFDTLGTHFGESRLNLATEAHRLKMCEED